MWLHVAVFSGPSSGQYFPVEGTIGAHYTLWDPMLFRMCVKTITNVSFLSIDTAEQAVVYLKHYFCVYCQLWRYFHCKNMSNVWCSNIQITSSSKTRSHVDMKYEVMLYPVYIYIYMHVHNVLDTLQPVQQCRNLKKKPLWLFLRTPCK